MAIRYAREKAQGSAFNMKVLDLIRGKKVEVGKINGNGTGEKVHASFAVVLPKVTHTGHTKDVNKMELSLNLRMYL